MNAHAEELATLIKDTLHDRLDNGTRENLAFEVASLRAFLFSVLDSLEHMNTHLRQHDVHTEKQMQQLIDRLSNRITNNLANLDDVREELKRMEAEA